MVVFSFYSTLCALFYVLKKTDMMFMHGLQGSRWDGCFCYLDSWDKIRVIWLLPFAHGT